MRHGLPGTSFAGLASECPAWRSYPSLSPRALREALLDDQTAVTVDLQFIDDDALIRGDPCQRPVPGARISGRIQGIMPNGQVSVTLRLSDQR